MGKIVRFLARGEVFVVAGVWLILLLVLGTLAQRDIGLFQAQETYFSSWVLWLGSIPVPGGRLTMAVVFVSLTAYMLQGGVPQWSNAGLFVAHLGALLLLAGAFFTAQLGQEGTMLIKEGETTGFVMDPTKREIALSLDNGEIRKELSVFSSSDLNTGRVFTIPGLSARFKILEFFSNCTPVVRRGAPDTSLKGLAQRYRLLPVDPAPDPGQNNACAMMRVTGSGHAANGVYAIVENASPKERLDVEGGSLLLSVRPVRTYLPFQLELTDFEKVDYPGTTMPKSYESRLNLIDGETTRQVVIAMNEPLRYRGYTVYQSSFIQGASGETTVLAAVKNYGRIFPYVASVVMCIGLLLHLGSTLVTSKYGNPIKAKGEDS